MTLPRLLILAAFSLLAAAAFAQQTSSSADGRLSPLHPDEAFVFSAEAVPGGAQVVFQMPDDIYIYRKRVAATIAAPGARVAALEFPDGQMHDDAFFGPMEVYFQALTFRVKVEADDDYELTIISQGCDEQLGICYPPKTDTALLSPVATAAESPGTDPPPSGTESSPSGTDSSPSGRADKAGDAAAILADGGWLWIVAAFFGFGLLLSFTPCVLPMLPILLGVVAGGDAGARGRGRTLALTGMYVAGVTATYTAAGIAAGFAGELLAVSLQRPPMLILFSVLIVALSLSMFGLYDLQAPSFLRNRAAKAGGEGWVGAFAMGGFAALAASPCVAAPLVGALLYIGKTGDALTGGLALFSLSLGMSALLLAAGATAGAALPKAGEWTADIKRAAGALLLGLAVWIASPLLPSVVQMILYGMILLLCGVLLRAPDALPSGAGGAARAAKALGCALLLWGALMLVGAASGGRDVLLPLSHLASASGGGFNEGVGNGTGAGVGGSPEFRGVADVSELDAAVAESAAAGRPAMLEFYADWCVSCKEFERFTLSDRRVQARLQNATLLRADVTDNNDAEKELLSRFGLFGPPALLFFGTDGKLNPNVRVIGYEDADDFLRTLDAAGI